MTPSELLRSVWAAVSERLNLDSAAAKWAAGLLASPVVVVGGAAFWFFVWRPLSKSLYYRAQGLKGSTFVPVVGDLPEMAKNRKTKPYDQWFTRFEEQFGRRAHFFFFGPEMRLRIGDPALVRGILVTHAACFNKPGLMKRTLSTLLGEGLLLTEGTLHKQRRKLISPAFNPLRLYGMTHIMSRASHSAVDGLLAKAAAAGEGRPLDFHEAVSGLTLYIIGKAAFGTDLGGFEAAGGAEDKEGGALSAADKAAALAAGGSKAQSEAVYASLTFLLDAFVHHIQSVVAFLPGFQHIPTPMMRRVRGEIAALRGMLQKIIAQRRQMREQAKKAGTPLSKESELLLDFLLDAEDAGDEGAAPGAPGASTSSGGGAAQPTKLNDLEILDETVTFVMAGHETTAQTLTWTMMLLAQPENAVWLERARGQVLSVLGSGRDTHVSREAVEAMPIITQILRESMRLFPPAPLVARECTSTVTIEGAPGTPPLTIARGTALTVPIASIHRDPALWPQPDKFDPARFKDGTAQYASNGSYLPFSAGPRNCIGSDFALLEAKVVLAVLLARLDWSVHPSYVHLPGMAITLRPERGMPMVFKPLSEEKAKSALAAYTAAQA